MFHHKTRGICYIHDQSQLKSIIFSKEEKHESSVGESATEAEDADNNSLVIPDSDVVVGDKFSIRFFQPVIIFSVSGFENENVLKISFLFSKSSRLNINSSDFICSIISEGDCSVTCSLGTLFRSSLDKETEYLVVDRLLLHV